MGAIVAVVRVTRVPAKAFATKGAFLAELLGVAIKLPWVVIAGTRWHELYVT